MFCFLSCFLIFARTSITVMYGGVIRKHLFKVTVQFETKGNLSGQNEIVSYMDRSEVKL